MTKLRIKSWRLRNFRSYGDYESKIEVTHKGPIFIIGEILDKPGRSNGAGKSTLVEALIWCLFGRMPGVRTPGDNIINWDNRDKECLVEITTEDGYIIKRTRSQGKSWLFIHHPDGTDISDSTTKNAQEHLEKLFGLDYEIFTSGMFFPQSGKPFLEMTEAKKRKALERLLGLSKFDFYAEVSKEKIQHEETNLAALTGEFSQLEKDITRIIDQISQHDKKAEEWETTREERVNKATSKLTEIDDLYRDKAQQLANQINTIKQVMSTMPTYDIKYVERQWSTYLSNKEKIEHTEKVLNELRSNIGELVAERDTLDASDSITYDNEEINRLSSEIKRLETQLSNDSLYDMDMLTGAWYKYNKLQDIISGLENNLNDININITKNETKVELLETKIKNWHNRSGQTCLECQQTISDAHVTKISKDLKDQQKKHRDEYNSLTEQKKQITSKLQKANNLSEEIKPPITIEQAEKENKAIGLLEKQITTLKSTRDNMIKQKDELEKAEEARKRKVQELSDDITHRRAGLITRLDKLNKAKEKNKEPIISVTEATTKNAFYASKEQEISNLQKSIDRLSDEKLKTVQRQNEEVERIKVETNPILELKAQLVIDLENKNKDKTDITTKMNNSDNTIKHLTYIHKSYSDRRKIKSYIISKLIPYLNDRIAYYLNSLECNVKLHFNSSLQFESDKWPYELRSGGEKRRIDLAIMFAIHDLHQMIYGKQCNIIVFDEYDRSLCKDGIEAFANLLFGDFTDKDMTIFVISHNHDMKDLFSNKIIVRKDKNDDGISKFEVA